MNRSRLGRLEQALLSPTAGAEPDPSPIGGTPEDRRQWWVRRLPDLTRTVFSSDDPRTDPTHLASLTLLELHQIYLATVNARMEAWRATNPPELDRFHRLSIADKMRVDYNGAKHGLKL
jgi:hypothetical protein